MGSTEQEQAEAMRRYIREVVIPEYAKNFNKDLSAEDIKFYGKIHFDRNRSSNQNNMHCHLIVSRKDQSNKIKISPLTNHKNTKKGTVKGGFDRNNLFQQVEHGFDKLFSYNRPLNESFGYYNVMKNGSISEQLKMQDKILASEKENIQIGLDADVQIGKGKSINADMNISPSADISQSNDSPDLGLSSALGIFSPEVYEEDVQELKKQKEIKKKRNKGLRW